MDLHYRFRNLIYVPELSEGRKTFLHLYWDGKSYSLREYSHPITPPRARYFADVGLTINEILSRARRPGCFIIGAPAEPNTHVRFWYERTVEANRKYLGVEPSDEKRSSRLLPSRPPSGPVSQSTVPVSPVTYRDQLYARFWCYREQEFAGADSLFDPQYQPGHQPPVFKREHAHRNVLIRPGASPEEANAVWAEISEGRRHRWFASMSSSQALAQSVFANLKRYDKLELLAGLRGEDGLPLFPRSVLQNSWIGDYFRLEYQVDYLGERRATSVDLMLGGQYRVAVECKLSEPDVGACSRPALKPTDSNYENDYCDGSYTRQHGRRDRCSLTEAGRLYWRYIPKLFTWPYDADTRPCPLLATYQLVRTILAACVRPGGDVDQAAHAVLLYDRRNPEFAEGGRGFVAYQSVRTALKNPALLKRGTWQNLVDCLRQDKELDWLTSGLRDKYGV